MEQPLVSISCLVYNHEEYLEQTLKGFLSQETNFPYEIVIHDDASTDGSAEIIKRYEEQYPDIVRPIYETENQYSKGAGIVSNIMSKIYRGKYVALCEGDDFWIDRYKLQIQVDYMEAHPECTLTMHDAIVWDCENQTLAAMRPSFGEHDLSPQECIGGGSGFGMFPTASYVLKRELAERKGIFSKNHIGDYPIMLNCFAKGTVHYFDRIMSVYRYRHKGSWTNRHIKVYERRILHGANIVEFLSRYDGYTDYRYHNAVVQMVNAWFHYVVYDCRNMGVDYFIKTCEGYDKDTKIRYERYFSQLKLLFKQLVDENDIQKRWAEFTNRFEHIVIMGAGKCGQIIASKLEKHGIHYDGFVVSDSQIIEKINAGRPIWYLCDIPFPKNKTGVLIGVSPNLLDEVLESLKAGGFDNYIIPYDRIEWDTDYERKINQC